MAFSFVIMLGVILTNVLAPSLMLPLSKLLISCQAEMNHACRHQQQQQQQQHQNQRSSWKKWHVCSQAVATTITKWCWQGNQSVEHKIKIFNISVNSISNNNNSHILLMYISNNNNQNGNLNQQKASKMYQPKGATESYNDNDNTNINNNNSLCMTHKNI